MTYEDLLIVPYMAGGRDESGMDCYGLVLECCARAGTPLRDIVNNGHVSRGELMDYVRSMNVVLAGSPVRGFVVQCEYNGELHIGYLIDKKRCLHMTESGTRVTPVCALRGAKFYEVINR